MAQRAAMVATGIAMATRIGLAGAGTASAAAPALKIKPFSTWTIEFKHGKVGTCEQVSFNTFVNTFVADDAGDAGTWSGGGSAISMAWTAGPDIGATFTGHFVSTTKPVEYQGVTSIDGHSVKTMLVKEVLMSYRGFPC
jgi:hypothetical protein